MPEAEEVLPALSAQSLDLPKHGTSPAESQLFQRAAN